MNSIASLFASTFRDFKTDGVSKSGLHEPVKSEIRAIGSAIEAALATLNLGGVASVTKDTRSNLNADLAHPADTIALVYADPTDANNDYYVKTGASGAGTWTLTSVLHDAFEGLAAPHIDAMELLAASVATFAQQRIGEATVNTTGQVWSAIWIVDPVPSTVTGEFATADIAVASAQDATFFVATLNGNGTLTKTAEVVRSLAAGVNMGVPVGLQIAAGQRIGVRCSLAPHFTNPGSKVYWYNNTGITANTPTIVSPLVNVEFAGRILAEDAVNVENAGELVYLLGNKFTSNQIGKSPVVTTGQQWTSTVRVAVPEPAPFDGYVTSFNIAVPTAAIVEVFVVTNNGDGTLTKTSAQTVNVAPGANNNVPVFIPIAKGQYVGFHSSVAVHFTNPGARSYYFANGPIGEHTSYIVSSSVTLEFGAIIAGEYLAKLNSNGAEGTLNPLSGKKWAALGTSITAQGLYTGPLASLTGMTLTNLGVGGAALGLDARGSPHYGSGQITAQIPNIPLVTEVVTLELPINDFNASAVPLGALGNTTTATFYGALWNAAIAIDSRVDNAKQVWIIGYGGGPSGPNLTTVNVNGNRLYQFQRAIKEVAEIFGIPVCDSGRNAGVGYLDADVDMVDDLHLDAVGGAKIANYMNWFFNQLVEQRYII